MKTKPLVILPAGPIVWPSHQYILPQLLKIWRRLDFDFAEAWLPLLHSDRDLAERVNSASSLIFPCGMIHYDGLQLLAYLRSRLGISTPAILMFTSGLNAGGSYLWHHRKTLRSTDRLIVNCTAEAQWLTQVAFSGAPLPITVAPLPVDESLFSPATDAERKELRRQLGMDENERLIVYSGRISAQKNLHSILPVLYEICLRHKHVKFVAVGPSDDLGVPHIRNQNRLRYNVELSRLIQRFHLQKTVRFEANVDQPRLAEWLKACDLHVSLTLHACEDYGYGIAQGLATGAPTVITRWGGGIDLARVASGVDVLITGNGPRVNLAQALSLIDKLLRTPSSFLDRQQVALRFAKNFGVDAATAIWRSATKNKSSAHRQTKFKLKKTQQGIIEPTDSLLYGKFLAEYSGQKRAGKPTKKRTVKKTEKLFYLNPLFDVQQAELLDVIAPIRQFKLDPQTISGLEALKRRKHNLFAPAAQRDFAVSRAAFAALVDGGIILPV